MIATSDFWETARLALDNLTMLHSAIHVHGNNHSPWCILGGVPIPDVLEVTLVRTADFTLEESSEIFPTSIDQANNHNEPDMYLGKFKF